MVYYTYRQASACSTLPKIVKYHLHAGSNANRSSWFTWWPHWTGGDNSMRRSLQASEKILPLRARI